jgi:hypothetical protein
MSATVAPPAPESSNAVYEALEKYPWADDQEFQAGLVAILGSNSTPEQATELTLRARCFYYARKCNVNIDFDGYKAFRDSRPTEPVQPPNGSKTPVASQCDETPAAAPALTSSQSEQEAPYPTSFAHIVELISTGQPIPGIKEIPNTVLTGQGTQPAKPKRRKPWEKEEASTGDAQTT